MSNENKWVLEMHQIECCNCSHGCGCQFAGYPDSDTGGCEALLGFYVKSGYLGDVDLTGVKVVFAASWPKAIHEGDGSAILFIDSAASEAQVGATATIFSGQAGGMPFEALAGTFTSVEGPIISDINMVTDDYRASFSIADTVHVQHIPLKDPMTGEDKKVSISFPEGGFLWNEGIIGTTEAMSLNHSAFSFEHVGNFAAKAEVKKLNNNDYTCSIKSNSDLFCDRCYRDELVLHVFFNDDEYGASNAMECLRFVNAVCHVDGNDVRNDAAIGSSGDSVSE